MNLDIAGSLHYAFFELLIPLSFTLSFIVCLWGSFQYFIAGGYDEAAREKGKSLIMYGIIVFAIMSAVWSVGAWIAKALGAG